MIVTNDNERRKRQDVVIIIAHDATSERSQEFHRMARRIIQQEPLSVRRIR